MKGVVLYAPYDIRVEEVQYPVIKPGYLIVKVRNTAICGTDVGIYKGKVQSKRPVTLGHESTGEVVEVGEGVHSLAVGDRVVLNSVIFCRSCSYCLSGKVNLCINGGLMGREENGTFAEYVLVPDFNAIKLPDCISYEDGTSLIALATVFQSHGKISIMPGQTVAVIGQGAAGLLQTRISVLGGADPVFAITRSQWKLDIAAKYGALTINSDEEDSIEAILSKTKGRGVDWVIESVGSGATLKLAMDIARPGGTVVVYGILPPIVDGFNGYAMYYKELKLLGSRGMTPGNFTSAINVVESGKLDLTPLVTHRFELRHVQQALELVDREPGKVLRAVVQI